MAKSQKRSSREAKKPKKTPAERLASATKAESTVERMALKPPGKRS